MSADESAAPVRVWLWDDEPSVYGLWELVEALAPFVQHLSTCGRNSVFNNRPCDCGASAALARIREAAPTDPRTER